MRLISSEWTLHVRRTNAAVAGEFSRPMILHDQNIAFPKGAQWQRGLPVDSKSLNALGIHPVIEILRAVIMEGKRARAFHGSLKGLSSFTSRRGFLFFGVDTQETQNRSLADPENSHLKESLAKHLN
jgi:hypothetical protein